MSPSFTLELLERLARVFKDYCGVLTEESIRKNFILIYELLDEMIVRCPCARVRLSSLPHPSLLAARRRTPHTYPSRPHRLPPQDYGYPQTTSTEQLKMYVHNEPIAVETKQTLTRQQPIP